MNHKDYYQILGINKNASQKETREAYRKLAFQFHPDRNRNNPAASQKMKEINEAYATLSNAVKRQEYDAMRERYGDFAYEHFRQSHSTEDIFRGSDINRIFDEFARMYGFRSASDIFSEAYGPGYKTFEFQRGGLFGRGFVFYGSPWQQSRAGDKNVTQPQGQGLGFPLSGIAGTLVKYFLRAIGMQLPERGSDWKDAVTLSAEQANLGGEIEYLHKKHGKLRKLMVKIPPGIKDGQHIRLKGMGSPGKGSAESGDLYLEVRIRDSLLKRIKKLLKQ